MVTPDSMHCYLRNIDRNQGKAKAQLSELDLEKRATFGLAPRVRDQLVKHPEAIGNMEIAVKRPITYSTHVDW